MSEQWVPYDQPNAFEGRPRDTQLSWIDEKVMEYFDGVEKAYGAAKSHAKKADKHIAELKARNKELKACVKGFAELDVIHEVDLFDHPLIWKARALAGKESK